MLSLRWLVMAGLLHGAEGFHADGLGEVIPVLVWCLRVNGKKHCFAS